MNNLLRQLRAENGLSEAYFADLLDANVLDIPRQTVNAIENGRYEQSLPLAFAITKVFSKPFEAIVSADQASTRLRHLMRIEHRNVQKSIARPRKHA